MLFVSRPRKIVISLFVILWTVLFHYESLRAFYLTPLFGRSLPKWPLLFPPAGWIMFYDVGSAWTTAEVYGLKGKGVERIDPHQIFKTRFVGFDNIHRNIMVNVLDVRRGRDFCRFLERKFPEYTGFTVVHAGYRRLTPPSEQEKLYQPLYQCS